MKIITKYLSLIALISTISACSANASASTSLASATTSTPGLLEQVSAAVSSSPTTLSDPLTVDYDSVDLTVDGKGTGVSDIILQGDSIVFEGNGATVNGPMITITSAGNYRISGTLDDGQLIVDTQDEDTVFLMLNGVEMTSMSSAPIYVRNAEKVVITLVAGTENVITDAESYVFTEGEDEPNAALFSNDDLTINGTGSLTVNANYRHGIVSDDDLKIVNGTITVTAAADGIKGKDSVAVRDGLITVNAAADALQADNDEELDKGYIVIDGGQLDLTAGLDGIQAESRLFVSDGLIKVTSGGGAPDTILAMDQGMGVGFDATDSTESTKGLKAGVDLTINGGAIQVNSLDDALHSNGSMMIAGGNLVAASGDDGLHADVSLTIQGGDLTITKSYEGIESTDIVILGGTIHVVSSDDGINGSGGGASGGLPGQGFFEAGDSSLRIEAGYLVVDALGDGIDINGPIDMLGGVVIVVGPIQNNNGALDYTGAFTISGGTLIAVGSAGMAEAPSASSSQYSVLYNFSSAQPESTLIHIESEDGEELLTFMPWREYASVVFSSPDLEDGGSYALYFGGSATGEIKDGLYSGAAYGEGQLATSFTIAGTVTSIGAAVGIGGGPGGNPGGPRPTHP